jgi:predicted transposase/invertase (TIGR01784 family)
MSTKKSKSTEDDAKRLHQIYDKLFKLVFEHEPSVQLFLRQFGDPKIVNQLNFKSLQLDTNSYLSKQLEAYFSDMVWKANWGAEKVAVAFLFEHKSVPERYVAVQLLEYISSMLVRDVKAKRPLTLVLPSIFNHGKRNWKPKTLVQLYDPSTQPLHALIPNFEIPCFRVDALDDETILALPNDTVLKSLFLILKHGKDEAAVKHHFPHFFSFYEDNPHLHRFLEPFVLHMSELTELKTETVTDLIEHTLSPKIKNQVMTTYAQFKLEGKIEGKIEGKLEGILQSKIEMLYKSWRKGFAIDIISDLTDLPETTIQLWMGRFETLRKTRLDSLTAAEVAPIVHLTEAQVTDWWAFMDKAAQKRLK